MGIVFLLAIIIGPAYCVIRYGWRGIVLGVLAMWILPATVMWLIPGGLPDTEGLAAIWWLLFGWIVAIVYCLILWAIRGLFLVFHIIDNSNTRNTNTLSRNVDERWGN